jgi:hypothetical protein
MLKAREVSMMKKRMIKNQMKKLNQKLKMKSRKE